jgi:N utilization substance protein B
MGARRSGREAALQMLFQLEASGVTPESAIELFWRTYEDADPEGKGYADTIVRGVSENLAAIDKRVAAASQNWRLERMSRVDRNLLRLGTWELMLRADVPRAVILDEAVELAKSFGTEESSGFVNGVLDRIANDLGRKDGDRDQGNDGAG